MNSLSTAKAIRAGMLALLAGLVMLAPHAATAQAAASGSPVEKLPTLWKFEEPTSSSAVVRGGYRWGNNAEFGLRLTCRHLSSGKGEWTFVFSIPFVERRGVVSTEQLGLFERMETSQEQDYPPFLALGGRSVGLTPRHLTQFEFYQNTYEVTLKLPFSFELAPDSPLVLNLGTRGLYRGEIYNGSTPPLHMLQALSKRCEKP